MNRRRFFVALAALPFVGKLLGKAAPKPLPPYDRFAFYNEAISLHGVRKPEVFFYNITAPSGYREDPGPFPTGTYKFSPPTEL